jgi:trk system potassium uptake protein TrkA
VILGGSGIGVAIARGLVHVPDSRSKLLEEDRGRAETLALALRHVEVLHGDGTDVQFLREVGVGSAGAFVAVTGDDARNLLACQLAKSLGARKTIALVHKPDYVLIYDLLGIDVAVSPRLLCANQILRFARGASVASVAAIEEGKAEVLELDVERDAPAAGRALADVGFPRGVVVGAIVRDGEVLVPRGGDRVRPGDTLVVFALAGVVREVEGFFRARREG